MTKKPSLVVIRRARMKDADRIIELLSKLGRPEPRNELDMKHFASISKLTFQKKTR